MRRPHTPDPLRNPDSAALSRALWSPTGRHDHPQRCRYLTPGQRVVVLGRGRTAGAASCASASSQYLSVASNSGLQLGNVDGFVAAWFKTSTAAIQRIVSKCSSTETHGDFLLKMDGAQKIQFRVASGAAAVGQQSASTYNDGLWHLAVGILDIAGAQVGLSMDGGAAVYTTLGAVTPATSTDAFMIGANSGGTEAFNGQIDAVIYAKPPTAIASLITAIIAALWNGGSGLAAKDITPAQLTAWGVVSGFDFDGAGNLTKDYIGTNTLTNNNGVTYTRGQVYSKTFAAGDQAA